MGLQLGFERATLETDSGTLVAIEFYNKTGWTEVTGTEDLRNTGILTFFFCRIVVIPGTLSVGFMELS